MTNKNLFIIHTQTHTMMSRRQTRSMRSTQSPVASATSRSLDCPDSEFSHRCSNKQWCVRRPEHCDASAADLLLRYNKAFKKPIKELLQSIQVLIQKPQIAKIMENESRRKIMAASDKVARAVDTMTKGELQAVNPTFWSLWEEIAEEQADKIEQVKRDFDEQLEGAYAMSAVENAAKELLASLTLMIEGLDTVQAGVASPGQVDIPPLSATACSNCEEKMSKLLSTLLEKTAANLNTLFVELGETIFASRAA